MVKQILRMTEIGYAAGRGLQQDVLLAQVEFSKLLDEKIILRKKYRTSSSTREDNLSGCKTECKKTSDPGIETKSLDKG